MNPFVNPKKRSILLPSGCKDLADVLRLPARQTGDPIKVFIREMLLQAEGVGATEILMGAPVVHDGECTITQRISGRFYHVSTIPAGFRSGVVAELLRMSALPESHFPASGLAVLQMKRRQVKWHLQIETAEGECKLTVSMNRMLSTSPNSSRQPTPEDCLVAHLASLARRGCAER